MVVSSNSRTFDWDMKGLLLTPKDEIKMGSFQKLIRRNLLV
jgi:hypothetical protein